MKNTHKKLVTGIIFAIVLTLNINTSLEFSLGGIEAKAFGNEIPCWSEVQQQHGINTVWCSGCRGLIGYKGVQGESTCVESNPGEN